MVFQASERVQRVLSYAIVDEVDSILIDEARTPLIISGQADDDVDLYYRLNDLVPKLARQPEENGPGDYWVDEKAHQVLLSEAGHENAEKILAAAGLLPDGHEPVRRAQHLAHAPPVRGVARALAVPSRPELRGAERRGDHRRRIHRAADARPALVGRTAPGGRGQGRRADPAREPDARVDHVPELLPHVRQARRHDRHGRHRGLRVPADLPPRNGGHSDPPADGPQGRERPRVPHLPGEGRRDHRRHQGLLRSRPAGAGGHDVDREFGAAVAVSREGKARAPGAERQAARARGGDRRPGGAARRGHHRHQHGGPRHRHRAGRHPRAADPRAARQPETSATRTRKRRSRRCARNGRSATTRSSRPAACTSSAPSATNRGASTTSCAAARAARATRLVALLPVARGSAAAHLRRRASRRDHAAAQDARGRADRASDRQPLDRQGAEPRRDAQLRHPQAAARIRRRRQRPAAGDLPAAQRVAGERRHRRHDPRHDRRSDRRNGQAPRAAGIGRGAVGRRGTPIRARSPTTRCRRRSPSG